MKGVAPNVAMAPPMLIAPEAPTPEQIDWPAALVPNVIETPTLTETTWKNPVWKFVPLRHWPTLPTMSLAAAALSTVFPEPELVSPVSEYCGLFCLVQSVPEEPAAQPPPLLSLPAPGRTSQTVAADRAMRYAVAAVSVTVTVRVSPESSERAVPKDASP